MNSLIFCMLVACAAAQWYPYSGYPVVRNYVTPYAAPYWTAPAPLANQYHAQDVFGQASYGYAYPGQAASNFRDAAGNQVGSYAYINPEGKEVKVSYTADSNGFRVLSNNLPVAPVYDGKAPEPVKDTPEVVAAKAEFFKLQKEAKREKRQIWTPYTTYAHAPVVAHHAYAAPVHSYVAPVATPVLAKSTVDTLVLEKDEKAKTPADTQKLTEKIVKHEVYTPTYKAVVPSVYPAYSWGYPAAYPAAYPAVWGVEKPIKEESSDDDSIKVEAARKKRQVLTPFAYVANHKPEQFKSDFEYSSVDLNQDGQPDNKPFYYAAYPYTFGYSSYPFVY